LSLPFTAANLRAMAGPLQTLTIVTPCYNEGVGVEEFHRAVIPVLEKVADLEFGILFVDDGSEDDTLEIMNRLAAADSRVQVFSLSRNFGHQVALTAGLDHAKADAVIMMDLDLQHPPSLLADMVARWREGNDIVSAIRTKTQGAGWFKDATSNGFYWLVNRLSDTKILQGAADFCLLSRRVCEAMKQFPERHRFLRGLISWVGFKRTTVKFEAPPRKRGASKFTIAKMLSMALHATLSFSITPVRLATQLGFFTVLLSLLYLVYIFVCMLTGFQLVPGWTSIIFLTAFFGGVQLAFIGVLGEYIGRIFEEVKSRPLYLLKQSPEDPPSDGDIKP
jgi:polyisoprenyl-phosphate glycosyltransferase